jgi:hypothetical protein
MSNPSTPAEKEEQEQMTSAQPKVRRGRALLATLIAALAVLLSFAHSPPAYAAEPLSPQSPGDAEKSIVLVGMLWDGFVQVPAAYTGTGSAEWTQLQAAGFCTGWFASESGHIVTAGHCVDPAEGRFSLLTTLLEQLNAMELLPEAYANWEVEGLAEGSPVGLTVQVVQPRQVDGAVVPDPLAVRVLDVRPYDQGDLALLRLEGLQKPTPALSVAEASAEIGDPLTAIGFPGSVSQVVDGTRIRASFKSGTASSQQVSLGGVAGTEINADLSPGMSGGPAIDAQGRALGVNSFLIAGEQQNFNFITGTEALREYLEEQNVPLRDPAPSDESSNDPSGPVPFLANGLPGGNLAWIVGAAALLVGMATTRLLFRRANTELVPAGQQEYRPYYGEQPHQRSWPDQYSGQPTASAPMDQGGQRSLKFCQRCGRSHDLSATRCGNCGSPWMTM